VVRREDLPEGTQVIRGRGGGGRPGVGAQPGRFSPARGGRRRRSKFAPLPCHRGESTLRGRVVDAAGTPVEDAEIYRIAAEADRASSTVVSYEFLTKIATTDQDGEFRAERQAHGTFLIAANYQRRLNRPGGMETRHAVPVQVVEQGTAANLLMQLPFNLGDSVPLRGVVTDAEGRPVRGAQVFVSYQEFRTDRDGAFDAGRIPAGTHPVFVRCTGYENLEDRVTTERGRDNAVKLVLELKETGELRFAGQVLDAGGRPVADAVVYLNAPSRTMRRGRTNERGEYVFDELPAYMEEGGCSVNGSKQGYFSKRVDDVPVPSDVFQIRIERAYPLHIEVVSAATGEILKRTRGRARRETEVDGETTFLQFRSWSTYREDGLHELPAPAGRVELTVEAPGPRAKDRRNRGHLRRGAPGGRDPPRGGGRRPRRRQRRRVAIGPPGFE